MKHRASSNAPDRHNGQTDKRTDVSLCPLSPSSTWLVTSRLDTTRHVRHVEPMQFVLCPACQTAGLDTLVSTRSTRRTCHVVSRRRAKWNFGFSIGVR